MPNKWTVSPVKDVSYVNFETIEQAAEFLKITFNIHDDEIDDAIIDMAVFDHVKAIFTEDGKFLETTDL